MAKGRSCKMPRVARIVTTVVTTLTTSVVKCKRLVFPRRVG